MILSRLSQRALFPMMTLFSKSPQIFKIFKHFFDVKGAFSRPFFLPKFYQKITERILASSFQNICD